MKVLDITIHYDPRNAKPNDFAYTEGNSTVNNRHHHANHKDWVGWRCKDEKTGEWLACEIQFEPSAPGGQPDCPFFLNPCIFGIDVPPTSGFLTYKIKNHSSIGNHLYKYSVTVPKYNAKDDPDIQVDGSGSWPFKAIVTVGAIAAGLFGLSKLISQKPRN